MDWAQAMQVYRRFAGGEPLPAAAFIEMWGVLRQDAMRWSREA